MKGTLYRALATALLVGGGAAAMAANDGQVRASRLLAQDPEHRETMEPLKRDPNGY